MCSALLVGFELKVEHHVEFVINRIGGQPSCSTSHRKECVKSSPLTPLMFHFLSKRWYRCPACQSGIVACDNGRGLGDMDACP
jgi:hypothetical protein